MKHEFQSNKNYIAFKDNGIHLYYPGIPHKYYTKVIPYGNIIKITDPSDSKFGVINVIYKDLDNNNRNQLIVFDNYTALNDYRKCVEESYIKKKDSPLMQITYRPMDEKTMKYFKGVDESQKEERKRFLPIIIILAILIIISSIMIGIIGINLSSESKWSQLSDEEKSRVEADANFYNDVQDAIEEYLR